MRPLNPQTTDVRQLQQKLVELEKKLAALQQCVQIDGSGQSLTLKATGDVTIDGGMQMTIKAGAQMKLVGQRIDLN